MLDEIRNFLVTAECLNFTASAKFLYIAQPALSKQISRLEEELGVKLFNRTTRSVSLTPAGEAFLSLCHGFVNSCDLLPKSFPRNSFADSGHSLVIGIGRHIDPGVVSQLLGDFAGSRESVGFSFLQRRDEELPQLLLSEEADFIFTFRSVLQSDARFDHAVVKSLRLNVVLWKDHPLADRETIRVSDLKNEFFIMTSPVPTPLMNMLHSLCQANGFFPKISAKVDSPQLSIMMTGARQGVTVTTFPAPQGAEASNLVFRAIDGTDVPPGLLENALVLAWRKDVYMASELVRQLADLASALAENDAEP